MALSETRYEHIVLDEHGVSRIVGTRLRVIDLVEAMRANQWDAEQFHEEHPELTLGQIYSALAYYWDHQDELDMAVMSRRHEIDRLEQQVRPSRLMERMRQGDRD